MSVANDGEDGDLLKLGAQSVWPAADWLIAGARFFTFPQNPLFKSVLPAEFSSLLVCFCSNKCIIIKICNSMSGTLNHNHDNMKISTLLLNVNMETHAFIYAFLRIFAPQK